MFLDSFQAVGQGEQVSRGRTSIVLGENSEMDVSGEIIQAGTLPDEVLRLKLGVPMLLYANTIFGAKYSVHILTKINLAKHSVSLVPIKNFLAGEMYAEFSLPKFRFTLREDGIEYRRYQFPLGHYGCISTHKAQGATLDKVAFFARQQHASGLLYVAMSRVRMSRDFTFIVDGAGMSTTFNIGRDDYGAPSEWHMWEESWMVEEENTRADAMWQYPFD